MSNTPTSDQGMCLLCLHTKSPWRTQTHMHTACTPPCSSYKINLIYLHRRTFAGPANLLEIVQTVRVDTLVRHDFHCHTAVPTRAKAEPIMISGFCPTASTTVFCKCDITSLGFFEGIQI